jgi:signal transduction histidine kinase
MQVAVEQFIKRATKLLDVSRIESGNLRLEPSETDLSAIAASVAQKYAVAAARGQSPLDLDLESGLVGFLDPLALEQVIDNLLSNALKFGIGKAVTFRLRSEGVPPSWMCRIVASAWIRTSSHAFLAVSSRS